MGQNLSKAELIGIVAERAGLTKAQANQAINETFQAIQDGLTQGKKFTMVGFGTFKPVVRQPRAGTNPRTGESMVIPGKLVAKFRSGKNLTDALNSVKSISEWVNN